MEAPAWDAGKTDRRQRAFEWLLTRPLQQPIKSLRWIKSTGAVF